MEQAYFDRISKDYAELSYTFMDDNGEETFTLTPGGWETAAGETKTWVELILFAIAMDAPLTVAIAGLGNDPSTSVTVAQTIEETPTGDEMNAGLTVLMHELEVMRRKTVAAHKADGTVLLGGRVAADGAWTEMARK